MTQFLLCGFLGSTGANIRRVWGGTAFAQRSETIKALLGLLSGRTVCASKMARPYPDKLRFFPDCCVSKTLSKRCIRKEFLIQFGLSFL